MNNEQFKFIIDYNGQCYHSKWQSGTVADAWADLKQVLKKGTPLSVELSSQKGLLVLPPRALALCAITISGEQN